MTAAGQVTMGGRKQMGSAQGLPWPPTSIRNCSEPAHEPHHHQNDNNGSNQSVTEHFISPSNQLEESVYAYLHLLASRFIAIQPRVAAANLAVLDRGVPVLCHVIGDYRATCDHHGRASRTAGGFRAHHVSGLERLPEHSARPARTRARRGALSSSRIQGARQDLGAEFPRASQL